jgi:hypothetical protein
VWLSEHRLREGELKFKKSLKITSRTSSVTNGFVQAIVPSTEPTDAQIEEALSHLGMTRETIECAYCGARATDWDHLRPLVKGKRPTGFCNEIRNIVPSCGPCNQSKGGQDWRTWLSGDAKGAPRARGIADVEVTRRSELLERYERWGNVARLQLSEIVSAEDWELYWEKLAEIELLMHQTQLLASKMQAEILLHIARTRIAGAL